MNLLLSMICKLQCYTLCSRSSVCISTSFVFIVDIQYDEDDDEITPDLWQEACWIVIR